MITTRDTKPYVYQTKLLSVEETSNVLTSIETKGKALKNRTEDAPEIANRNLPNLPNLGPDIIIDSISDVEGGPIPAKFIENIKSEFLDSMLKEISPYGVLHLRVSLEHSLGHPEIINGHIMIGRSSIYVGFSFDDKSLQSDPGASVAWARQLIDLVGIPVEAEKKNNKYIVRHKQNGRLWIEKTMEELKPEDLPSRIYATLPQLTPIQAVEKFRAFIHRPEFKVKSGRWSAIFDPEKEQPNPGALLKAINKSGLPIKNTKYAFFWYLKDYTCFKDMQIMAKSHFQSVAQSLLGFEFGNGKSCWLDAACTKQNKYQLYFSFDKKEDFPAVEALLGIKLKEF
jgi:hypothetical protein